MVRRTTHSYCYGKIDKTKYKNKMFFQFIYFSIVRREYSQPNANYVLLLLLLVARCCIHLCVFYLFLHFEYISYILLLPFSVYDTVYTVYYIETLVMLSVAVTDFNCSCCWVRFVRFLKPFLLHVFIDEFISYAYVNVCAFASQLYYK